MKKGLQILLVDDDADDRSFFVNAVREFRDHIVCSEAKNGEEALMMLKDASRTLPDCIFLDLRMPRLSGKECLRAIKSDERLQHIPIYIYTTSRDQAESDELKKIGAMHFISKPSSDEDVYFLVACALEEHERFVSQQL